MGDKKLRSDIVNLRVVAILAVIFGHSTTIYWYNWTDYRTTQEAPVFAHVGNLAMLVLGLWMLISGFCVGFTLRGKKRFKDFFIKRFGSVKPTLTYERGALIREEVQTFSLWPLLLNGYRYSKARGVHVQHQCSGCGS